MLAFKEIKAIQERHRELHLLGDQLNTPCHLHGMVINICTD
jgi:hypothetical protein